MQSEQHVIYRLIADWGKEAQANPQERSTWRSGVRSARRAASQLPGSGPTDVDDACRLIKNLIMIMICKIYLFEPTFWFPCKHCGSRLAMGVRGVSSYFMLIF